MKTSKKKSNQFRQEERQVAEGVNIKPAQTLPKFVSRKKLADIEGQRNVFTATFERFGFRKNYRRPGKTVLLIDVAIKGRQVIADHLWFNLTKRFKKLRLSAGILLQFEAYCHRYLKGNGGPVMTDWKLGHPTNIEVIRKRGA